MRNLRIVMVVIVVGVVMLAALNRFSAASAQANGREVLPGWQYKIAYNASEKQLNDLGSQGWELSATIAPNPANQFRDTFIFKRATIPPP